MFLEPIEREDPPPPADERRQGAARSPRESERRVDTLMMSGAVLGALSHVGLMVLFAVHGLTVMVVANVVSVVLWVIGGFVARRGYRGGAIGIVCGELVAHACLAVWQVGMGAGFQLYLWSAACLLVLNPYMRSELALLAGVCVSLIFACLHLLVPTATIVESLSAIQAPLYFVNALGASLPVVFVVIMVRQAFKSQQAALREVAARDEVTGIFNRRHGMRVLTRGLDETSRSGDALFVMLGDIDHFKQINDAYGHHMGDTVLAHVASVLAGGLRSDDMLCRWGGEEFLMVLHGFRPQGVRDRMDELRSALEVTRRDDIPGVTMSFGLTRARPGDTPDEIVRRADLLMYEAKRQGRNCIVDDLQPRAVAMSTNPPD